MYYDSTQNAIKNRVKVNLSHRKVNVTIFMSKALQQYFREYKLTTAPLFFSLKVYGTFN